MNKNRYDISLIPREADLPIYSYFPLDSVLVCNLCRQPATTVPSVLQYNPSTTVSTAIFDQVIESVTLISIESYTHGNKIISIYSILECL
jgi:hypothetical protein